MTQPIESVLADARDTVNTLRRFGSSETAKAIDELLDRICETREVRALLTWHDEPGASMLGEKSADWFRSRFRNWRDRGLARLTGRVRQYREVVIEYDRSLEAVTADAEATAERERVA